MKHFQHTHIKVVSINSINFLTKTIKLAPQKKKDLSAHFQSCGLHSLKWIMDVCHISKSVVKLTGIGKGENIEANLSPDPC